MTPREICSVVVLACTLKKAIAYLQNGDLASYDKEMIDAANIRKEIEGPIGKQFFDYWNM